MNNENNFRDDTNFSFAWTIENFGRKMEVYKNGECLTSDTFKVEVEGVETAWKLECFPNGKQKIGEPKDCKNICEVKNIFVLLQARTLPGPSRCSSTQQTPTPSTDSSASP